MKAFHTMRALFLAGVLVTPIAACSSTPTTESTGEYIDDSVISNKVRAQLLGDRDLNVSQIDVTTYRGVVQLSGFVNSPSAKSRAGAVVATTQGVKEVRNNLVVK